MEQWEYKIIELETWQRIDKTTDGKINEVITFQNIIRAKGMFGTTKTKEVELTSGEIEDSFNCLGKKGWKLCETVPLTITSNIGPGANTDRVYFIFKRKKI